MKFSKSNIAHKKPNRNPKTPTEALIFIRQNPSALLGLKIAEQFGFLSKQEHKNKRETITTLKDIEARKLRIKAGQEVGAYYV